MAHYRQRPPVVEAAQLMLEHVFYNDLTAQWESKPVSDLPDWVRVNLVPSFWSPEEPSIRVTTVNGEVTARVDEWFIRGTSEVVYQILPADVFAATYELVG